MENVNLLSTLTYAKDIFLDGCHSNKRQKHTYTLLFAIIILSFNLVSGQIVVDNTATGSVKEFNNLTVNHTVSSGLPNSVVVVSLWINSGLSTINTLTYGGLNLTLVKSSIQGSTTLAVYTLINPPAGNNALSINTSNKSDKTLAVTSFSNVDQNNIFSSIQSQNGSSSNVSKTIDCTENSFAMDFLSLVDKTPTVGTGQTVLFNKLNANGADRLSSSYKVASSGIDNLSWNFPGTNYNYIWGCLNPALPPMIDFDGIDDYIDFGNVHNQTGVFSIEAWILQEAATPTGAIISKGDVKSGAGNQRGYHLVLNNGKPNLTWYNATGTTILNIEAPIAITNNKWHHIAAVYNGTDAILYVDGAEVKRGNPSSPPVSGTGSFFIGAMYDSTTPANPKKYFNGFIDEVRIWNVAITAQQIREMMNQEIELSGTAVKGRIIPKDVSGGLLWANLKGYYPMNDDTATDRSGNEKNGIPKNIHQSQAQTAPMPYVSSASGGNWTSAASWLHGNVWEIDNTVSNKDWSIVKLSSNVTACHNVKTFGLIIDSGVTFTLHGESLLENINYLELNGTIDLKDDSQLIQTNTSDLVTSATGKLLRRQEGTSNAFRYNYWSSPVGITGVSSLTNNNAATNNPNNTGYKLNMLKDESGFNMQFTSSYNQSGKISAFWLYTYKNGLTYWDWELLSPTASLAPGIGYTQKGTGNAGLQQQYIFEGKPNNGTILVNVNDKGGPGSVTSVSKTEYLLGNPYPSAIDIHKFIDDNVGVIDGTLNLWEQWAGDTHYLDEYKGGYAQVNKLGSCKAFQFIGVYGANNGSMDGTKRPSRYLPVGQGFIAEITASGTVIFKNSQRVFIKETDTDGTYNNGSLFLKSFGIKSKGTSSTEKQQTNEIQKIRLEFNSVVGSQTRREVLLGFSDVTTDGLDYGYDALCGDTSNNDFNLSLEGQSMNMQAYSPITAEKVIPLNFKSSGNNTFEIKATEFENLDDSQDIYLKDNETGTYFDLKQNEVYRFSSAVGKFNNRFEIVFQSESKLLAIEESNVDANFIYYQKSTKTLFGKKLNTSIDKLAIVNMRGQTVQEFNNLSEETLNYGIKLNNMASGAYVAWFKAKTGQVITKKIIIN